MMRTLTLCLLTLLFLLILAAPALALTGPVTYQGKTYYMVTSSDQSEDTGAEVCAKAGRAYVGYTALTTDVCKLFHPSAEVTSGYDGSSTGFYCDGPLQGGVCARMYDTCNICPACNLNVDANTVISDQYHEMFVECQESVLTDIGFGRTRPTRPPVITLVPWPGTLVPGEPTEQPTPQESWTRTKGPGEDPHEPAPPHGAWTYSPGPWDETPPATSPPPTLVYPYITLNTTLEPEPSPSLMYPFITPETFTLPPRTETTNIPPGYPSGPGVAPVPSLKYPFVTLPPTPLPANPPGLIFPFFTPEPQNMPGSPDPKNGGFGQMLEELRKWWIGPGSFRLWPEPEPTLVYPFITIEPTQDTKKSQLTVPPIKIEVPATIPGPSAGLTPAGPVSSLNKTLPAGNTPSATVTIVPR